MIWLAIKLRGADKLYHLRMHSSIDYNFYLLWLLSKNEDYWTHPKTKERIEKEHWKWFISWSPWVWEWDSMKMRHKIHDLLIELVCFWALSEIHIQFSKQENKNDSLFCDKEFIVDKKSDIEKMDWAISTYVQNNLDEVVLVHYFIKIDQVKTKKYLDEYLWNCIADNMEDNDVLLYNFEKQLNIIREEIIQQRYNFGKRRFEIKVPYVHTIKKPCQISLFSVLYYLEQEGNINIEAPASWPKDFDCSIPESFIVSITDNWNTYFDQFDSQKKIDALLSKSRARTDIASKKQNNTQVSFNDKTKELIIGWKIKKLKQKQVIFIDSLFDLQNKINDWWVGLDDIAIAEDHVFEEKSESEQEKIIKNFYDIGNHLNKSIKLETGFEKVLEITTQEVRISPIYTT